MAPRVETHFVELYARARAKVPVKVRLTGGHIQDRNPWVTVALVALTAGLYGIYWLFSLSRELKKTTEHPNLHPYLDLVLMVLSGGLYGIVVMHRHARLIHGVSMYFDRSHPDRSGEILTFGLGALVSFGILGLFGVHALQRQMNDLGFLADERMEERARRGDRSSDRFLV